MIQTLIQNWWLLGLCGVIDAILAATNLLMPGPDGSLTLRTFVRRGTAAQMGMLVLAAGACTIAAGVWNSRKSRSWPLVLNGFALGALGLIFLFMTGREVAFSTVALLLAVAAVTIGIFELAAAQDLRRHVGDRWFLGLAGAASVGFALAFLVMALHWVSLERPESGFLLLGSYFGFCAICMLEMAVRLNSLRTAIHRMAGAH